MNVTVRPTNITVDRESATLVLQWADGHSSSYPLRWLRAHCPCATCREERRNAALDTDVLKLSTGPAPSTAITTATLVGNYAIRLTWNDGHEAGIYAFTLLRASCPCVECHPEGPPATFAG